LKFCEHLYYVSYEFCLFSKCRQHDFQSFNVHYVLLPLLETLCFLGANFISFYVFFLTLLRLLSPSTILFVFFFLRYFSYSLLYFITFSLLCLFEKSFMFLLDNKNAEEFFSAILLRGKWTMADDDFMCWIVLIKSFQLTFNILHYILATFFFENNLLLYFKGDYLSTWLNFFIFKRTV
jgi:hypothetical protein